MQITNNEGMPQSLFQAVVNDDYDSGDSDLTVTSAISPPRKVALEKRHKDILTEEASSRLYALLGQSLHVVLERADTTALTEKRLSMDVLGWRYSGQFDRLTLGDGDILQDYKQASVWEYIYGVKPEREEQLNCLAYLCRHHGYPVAGLQIIFVFRDWMKSKAKTDREYPQRQWALVDIPVWSAERAWKFIENRVRLHQAAQNGSLPLCTDEERWYSGDKFAVKKKGRKTALRVLNTQEDAEAWIIGNANGDETTIEFRPGQNKRCDDYCSAAPVCEQYQQILEGTT